MLNELSVLVTGGTGSFGKEFARTVLRRYPEIQRLIIYSRDELKQFEMQQEFPMEQFPQLRFFIGDVRDGQRLQRAAEGVHVIVHAAALKQVPTAEYNPFECIQTNVLGAQNVVNAALSQGVRRVVALSTDKAAAPINLYGATKLCSDKLFVAANNMVGSRDLRFSVVRYGNVMGSRGSVIPFFLEKRGSGVLPITDPEMTRFNIVLSEGVELVLHALANALGGEIFVPKIPSYRITDLAEAIGPHCSQEIVGIRAGEKLHEEMLTVTDSLNTIETANHYIIVPSTPFQSIQETVDCYSHKHGGTLVPTGFSYCSKTNTEWLTVDDLRELILEHMGINLSEFQKPAPDTRSTIGIARKSSSHSGATACRGVLPYSRQTVDEDDVDAVTKALRSAWLTTGPAIADFEEAFAECTGSREAVAVCNGTAALHCAMAAIDIQPNDEVVVPAMTFAATANCVVFQGGKPVFADVEPDTLLMAPAAVEACIGPRTKAIIAVDYAGHPCDYDALRKIADQYELALVSDACHSLGGAYKNRPVGSLADLSTFSLHPVKPITTGEGGVITTNDADLAARMRIFRNHGITSDHRKRAQQGVWWYDILDLGYNYRITDFQCALGISQLRKLSRWTKRRQEIAQEYINRLAAFDWVRPLQSSADVSHAYHLFVVRLDTDALQAARDTVFSAMRDAGIGVNVHYRPVHLHSYYRNRFDTRKGLCPVAEAASERILSLPIFPAMTAHHLRTVVDAIERIPEHVSVETPA